MTHIKTYTFKLNERDVIRLVAVMETQRFQAEEAYRLTNNKTIWNALKGLDETLDKICKQRKEQEEE